MVVRWEGNRLVWNTGEKIEPGNWNKKPGKGYMMPKKEYPDYEILSNILRKLEMRELLTNKCLAKVNFFEFYEQFISELPNERSKIQYRQTKNALKEFRSNLNYADITIKFYYKYVEFLEKKKGYAKNNVGKHISRLKAVCRDAYAKGKTDNREFMAKKFKTLSEKINNIYLNEEELETIFKLDLSDRPMLDNARDLFLIGAWTGLRYSDFSRLKPENIDGEYIEIETKKTGETVVIWMHPVIMKILKKHNGQMPRTISLQKLNNYIKDFCKLIPIFDVDIEIKKTIAGKKTTQTFKKHERITTHTARRSFASNMYQRKMKTYDIMKITGHKTESVFLNYIKVTEKEHAEKMRDVLNGVAQN
jgi:integrase